jgi:FixJ family two-component response regulator
MKDGEEKLCRGIALIVEDDDKFRKVMIQMSDLVGFTTYGASDGVEGLEMVEKVKPNIILSDMTMPRLSGELFLKELRKRGDQTVFAFVSGSINKKSTIRAMQLGAFDFFEKPIMSIPDLKNLFSEMYRVSVEQKNARDAAIAQAKESEVLLEMAISKISTSGLIQGMDLSNSLLLANTESKQMSDFIIKSTEVIQTADMLLKSLLVGEVLWWKFGNLFRISNYIKTAATHLSLTEVVKLTTAQEEALVALRTKAVKPNKYIINNILGSFNTLQNIISVYAKPEPHAKMEQEVQKRYTQQMIMDLKQIAGTANDDDY